MNFPVNPCTYSTKGVSKGEELVLLSADLFQDKPVAVNTMRKTNSLHYDKVLGPVNGLICFIDTSEYAVQIYNVCTREVTPWISSAVFMEEKRMTNSGKYLVIGGANYQFGFDAITNEHKVVFGWRILDRVPCQVCEVLTVGDNKWRTIDEVPLIQLDGHGINVHANGSLYWYVPYWRRSGRPVIELNDDPTEDFAEFLVVFDIGSEKFRMIKIPGTHFDLFGSVNALLEVDEGIAILRRNDDGFEMWIFDDRDKKENGTTTNSVSDKLWSTAVTITLPCYLCSDQPFYFHSISGTDQIIIETNTETLSRRKKFYEETGEKRIALTWIYSYNWKENTMAKIDIRAISSAIPSEFNWVTKLCSTFVESLLTVRKKLHHHGTQPQET
ncbi:uncharacterized protein LOC113328274 isoform X1 [Papaver somniferum]|uniref:uncharacterized protein LOC113328274 isoform X1 n=2 Tax=Papaver somniferum TaxID=3469 RepID=UPI000E6FBD42|nr:uncharacterized protein LOC113328274 isoform X1 [Papaver somniferum]